PEGVVPQHHAVLLGVALGDAGDLAPVAGPGQVEREAHDALAADFGEYGRLHGHFPTGAAAGKVAPACADVFAFAVLADDDPAELGVVGLAKGAAHPRQETDRAHVGPLVEVLADGQP